MQCNNFHGDTEKTCTCKLTATYYNTLKENLNENHITIISLFKVNNNNNNNNNSNTTTATTTTTKTNR